tara:strand:+ start:1179 stop:2279 length:1101 start_codon:yes stop_codon:yes gene_type:complete
MSQLTVGSITAGRVVASGYVSTTGQLQLPSYDQGTRPNSAPDGVLIWNNTQGAINLKSGSAWISVGSSSTPTWTNATQPSSGSIGSYGYNTEEDKFEVYLSNGWNAVGGASAGSGAKGTQSNPATDAQEILETSPTAPTDGLYYIDTPNGGVQQIYCIFDKGAGWMVVGKFGSDASNTVANTVSTTRGLTVQNSTGTEFSADFGDYYPSFVRHIGVDNISDWSNNRNLDFWHGVPNDRQWKRFWTNGRSSGMDRVRREGFSTQGTWDGRGRWANPDYTFMQMSDSNTSISEGAFTSSGSFYLHNAQDAKFSTDSHRSTSGQDEEVQCQYGYDDSRRCFMDRFTDGSRDGNNTNRRDYSSAVYVLLH